MLKTWFLNFIIYFISSGFFYLFFSFFLKKNQSKKIQLLDAPISHRFREFKNSFIAIIFSTSISLLIINPYTIPYTLMYMDGDKYGIPYFIFSILVCLFLHDTYFYWTHRLLHRPFFRFVHKVHHQSTNPTSWSAFAFHPIEAIIQAFILSLLPFIIPLHPIALLVFFIIIMIWDAYGHSGFEIFSKRFLMSKWGRWINSSITHNMHHEFYEGNYGLYFRFWDIWMKTSHPKYNDHIVKVKDREAKKKP
ncbi:sterol desaturase family protein [Pedobacter arcticus]|uniref:sterol desaturase family protein n=1 Tax=Pedobacter arcticus TaxID=752140 RepID=UPI0002FC3F08|nr:sterol desaturase family protein [Pedobacter arcticus]